MINMKKGDIIMLDCGYDGGPNDKECRLLENPYRETNPLFANDKPSICALVEIVGTDEQFVAVLPS